MTQFCRIYKNITLLIITLTYIFLPNGYATQPTNTEPSDCKVDRLAAYLRADTGKKAEDSSIFIDADTADSSPLESILTGNVNVERGDELLIAEKVRLDRQTNIVSSMNDKIRYATPNLVVEGESATLNNNTSASNIDNSQYYFNVSRAQGSAKNIQSNSNDKLTNLKEVTYSTCARGSEAWQVRAKRIELDQDEGRGKAWGAKFVIKNQPILYTPYISFPINEERQSGLLVPTMSMSEDSGFGIRVPYYINIAPQMDATITPGILTKRGILLGSEFRYLTNSQTINLSLEVLPYDNKAKKESNNLKSINNKILEYDEQITFLQKFNSQSTDQIQSIVQKQNNLKDESASLNRKILDTKKNRWSVRYDHSYIFNDKLISNILFQQVSDKNYLKDLDDAVGLLSTTKLERIAQLQYSTPFGILTAKFQHFQILDPEIFSNVTYSRMPQLTFNSHNKTKSGFQYGIDSELVHFKAGETNQNKFAKSATRLDLMPYVGYRFENSAGFINPKLSYRFTNYQLKMSDKTDNMNITTTETKNRAMPIVSIDSGLIFERDHTPIFSSKSASMGKYVQTLEPRIYYLYSPYRNQQDIPLFDTDLIEPSFSGLFKENRFTGADRQSNANQLTTALTTRFINTETGIEKIRISAGQIQYFSPPRITSGKDIDDQLKKSEWITEAEARWGSSFSTSGSWRWDPRYSKSTRTAFDFKYQPDKRRILNFGYRNTLNIASDGTVTDPIKQFDISTFWEINSNWAVLGRYNYAFSDRKTTDSFLGVEYNDCCVAFRALTRYSRSKLDEPATLKAYAQVEFIGIGGIGNSNENTWKEAISGYEPQTRARLKF